MFHEFTQRTGIPHRCSVGVDVADSGLGNTKLDAMIHANVLLKPGFATFKNILLSLRIIPRSVYILNTVRFGIHVILVKEHPMVLHYLGGLCCAGIKMNI